MTRTVWVEEVFDWSGGLDEGEEQEREEGGENENEKDQSSREALHRHEGSIWQVGLRLSRCRLTLRLTTALVSHLLHLVLQAHTCLLILGMLWALLWITPSKDYRI